MTLTESSAFDLWATQAQLPNSQPLQEIGHETEGPCIGIDAVYFLEELQVPGKVSLSPILGAFPRSTEEHIVRFIKDLESVGCKVYFFFNGLDTNFDEGLPAGSSISNIKSFRRSNSRNGAKDRSATDPSAASGGPDNEWYCSCLKTILHAHSIPYVVAPFKAHAQMVHSLQEGAVDALYGPTDLFLYGAPKVITRIRLQYDSTNTNGNSNQPEGLSFNPGQSKIIWLELDQCLKMLGDVPLELFQDAMYVVGNRSLDPFPPLRDNLDPQVSLHFKEVVASLNQIGGNILQFCERHPPVTRGNWLDRYMRAHQAIKHMVILIDYGTIKPRTYKNAQRIDRPPSDIHELVGLQLPAELYHYQYHGMISTRVLNWLISGKIKLSPPLVGEDGEAYRRLVREQLDPWRKQALALLAYILSHYWQRKEIVTHSWFGSDSDQKFNMKDLTSEKSRISTWRVKQPLLDDRLKALQKTHSNLSLGSLQFAVSALTSSDFVSKTISPSKRPNTEAQLQTSEEITCNVLWRLLQLRGYTNEKHELTAWGKFLQAALSASSWSNELAQSIFVTVELARLNLLAQPQKGFEEISLSSPSSDSDKAKAAMVLYLACTGSQIISAEKQKRTSSSNHILTYHALVTEIRSALRDLIDMSLATMFLDDEVERTRDDILDISASLPFQEKWSADLATVTAYAFEKLSPGTEPDDKKNLQAVLQQVEVHEAIKTAGNLCDAFEAAVHDAPSDLISSELKSTWTKANTWFESVRRS